MLYRFSLLVFALFLFVQKPMQAQQLSPDATVSILTCSPGEEVYSMYGHTAIRISDPMQGIDAVFNYGVFSFESSNFIYRFAKGQTDYLMLGQKFSSFFPDYQKEKRSVYEQILNLSPEGKNHLFQALITNARPENRVYRYNFFTDNCATRVRDMIGKNAGDSISFSEEQPKESYRQLIKLYHRPFRWTDLGIDLLVGKKAEEPVTAYGQMFLPEYLMDQFAKAKIAKNGTLEPFVLETKTLLEFPSVKLQQNWPWPSIVFGLLFVFILIISTRAYLRKKSLNTLDLWLLGLTGFAGFIIGWFTLYSEHPAMSPNYNLLWAFPLNLFFPIAWLFKRWRKYSHYYFYLLGVVLILSFFSGQYFNPAVYFIILILLTRVTCRVIPARK